VAGGFRSEMADCVRRTEIWQSVDLCWTA